MTTARSISSLTPLVHDYEHMQVHGVRFTEPPCHEPYGWVVVFLDLYGNKWDLIQREGPRNISQSN